MLVANNKETYSMPGINDAVCTSDDTCMHTECTMARLVGEHDFFFFLM
jgi:hypothetical protein